MGEATRVYLFSVAIVFIVFLVSLFLSSSFPVTSSDTAIRVLENVITLNGVLFGFTAVMLSIVYHATKSYKEFHLIIMVFAVTSFLSYLLSLYMSFCFLMNKTTSGIIFTPVFLTCFGGLCSSVYIVLTIIRYEKG